MFLNAARRSPAKWAFMLNGRGQGSWPISLLIWLPMDHWLVGGKRNHVGDKQNNVTIITSLGAFFS